MKICPKCNIFKIKNSSYDVCYTCHSNKDESSSETEQTPKSHKYSKENLSRNVLGMLYGLIFLKILESVCVNVV